MKNRVKIGIPRTQSVDSGSGSPDTNAPGNTKNNLVKHKSLCTMAEYAQHTDNAPGDVVLARDWFQRTSSSSSPRVRVSSGASFYGHVVAQQQWQATQDLNKKSRAAKKNWPDMEIQPDVSCREQLRVSLERSTRLIFFILFCQACVSVRLYYLIATLECTRA